MVDGHLSKFDQRMCQGGVFWLQPCNKYRFIHAVNICTGGSREENLILNVD